MKKVIVALIILAVILAAGILESFFIEKTFKELNSRLYEIKETLAVEDAEKSLELTDSTIAWWEKKRHFMECFTWSPDLRLLSVSLGEARGSLLLNDTKNAMSKTESIIVISNNLREILNFNLQDII